MLRYILSFLYPSRVLSVLLKPSLNFPCVCSKTPNLYFYALTLSLFSVYNILVLLVADVLSKDIRHCLPPILWQSFNVYLDHKGFFEYESYD